ncbi:MAG: hypothetical protein HQ521_20135 [Bacteroidetes bacterium]|nr:hypothetical protein [Bacteroidota bacterium]
MRQTIFFIIISLITISCNRAENKSITADNVLSLKNKNATSVLMDFKQIDTVGLKGLQVISKKELIIDGTIEFSDSIIKVYKSDAFEKYMIVKVVTHEDGYELHTNNNRNERCIYSIIYNSEDIVQGHFIDLEMMAIFHISNGFATLKTFYNDPKDNVEADNSLGYIKNDPILNTSVTEKLKIINLSLTIAIDSLNYEIANRDELLQDKLDKIESLNKEIKDLNYLYTKKTPHGKALGNNTYFVEHPIIEINRLTWTNFDGVGNEKSIQRVAVKNNGDGIIDNIFIEYVVFDVQGREINSGEVSLMQSYEKIKAGKAVEFFKNGPYKNKSDKMVLKIARIMYR